ncbi:MAG TPA: spore germination protein, partial [Firmicutes bacterium]|nr:spore germination protein [Bacillota bacterium]
SEPPSEKAIRGPREGFTETLRENIAMVRRWVRDPELRVTKMQIGTRTHTDVAIMYLGDVANPDIVTEVRKRLAAIKIDAILEAGYLEQLITDSRTTLFPLTQATERSDKVTSAILEGRVAIIVDKSASAIIVPTTVNELYQSPEDYYYDFWLGTLLRVIRLIGNNLAIALP